MAIGSFYNDHREAVIHLLKELAEGLAIPCRIAHNDPFEYIIMHLDPPSILAFFGIQYFVTVRMDQAQFRLEYRDDDYKSQADYYPDLTQLADGLTALKPLLHRWLQRWEDNVKELEQETNYDDE